MKNFINRALVAKKHLKLFFALFAMLALGVGNAWAETSSQVFDFTSGTTMPAGVVNSGGVAFATTRFCFDTKNDNIVITPTIPTNTTSISIVVKGLMNSTSANAGIIGVYGLSSNGSNVENASGTFTQSRGSVNNASAVDSKTVNETEIKFAAENVAKIKINCDTYSKKYIIRSVTITYETAGGDEGSEEPVLSSIAISGDLTNKTYEEGDELDLTGLTVLANYKSGDPKDVTNDVEWSYEPLTVGQPSVTVTATYEGLTAIKTINDLTVIEHVVTPGEHCTGTLGYAFWGLAAEKLSATANEINYTKVFNDITVNIKNGQKANAYFKSDHTRVYSGGYTMTFSVPNGYIITNIAFTASGSNGEGNHTANVGTMSDNKNWTGANQNVTITFNGNCRIASICVTYKADVKYALTITEPAEGGSLVVKNGETIVTTGSEFYEDTELTVTATAETGYEDGKVVVKDADGNDVTATVYADGVLTMPAYAVTISATFEKKPCTLLNTPVVTATPTYNSATLSWGAVTNAAKYSVKVGETTTEVTEPTYTATGLNAETTYTYQVQAIAKADQDTDCDSEVAESTFTTATAPPATLTLKDIVGTTTQTGALNSTITLPTEAAECSKTFVGWSAVEIPEPGEKPATNFYAPGAEYTLAAETQTLYAVYADGEAGEALQWTIKNDDLKVLDSSQSSGYAKYAGDQEKDGVTFNITSVMPATGENNGKIQMQAEKATIYNKTAMPGNIISIAIDGVDLSVYEGTEVISSTPSSGAITKNSEVYNFSSGKRYFHLKKSTKSAGYANSITVTYASAPTYSNYSTTCAAAPTAEVGPTSVTATAAETTGKLTVTYDNVNTEDVTVALYNDAACTDAFTAGWLTASLDNDKNVTYTVFANTLYTERKAYIKLTAPETTGAVDPAVVVIPVTQAAKDKVFASLAELVAADLAEGDEVTVTLNNDVIKEFYIYSYKRCGVVFDVQKGGEDIKIFFNSQTTIDDWAVGGKLSGTLTNVKWTTYNSAWQLAPANTWAWANLTYTEPKAVSTVVVSGTPTKTTYVDGEAFDPAGLTVTVNYNDATSEENPTGVTFNVTPATLTKGQTSVNVTATYNSISSAAYEVTSLTVNDIPTKTVAEFIAAEGGRCYLEGIVSNITNTTYGNFDLTDASDKIYIYGCLDASGESKKFATLGVKEGDKIKVIADTYELYEGTKQEAKNVQYVSHISAASITVENITMEVDEVATISATVDPVDAVVTYTIKENAANAISLSGNTITALEEGTATITATVAEGADYLGTTKDFTVTVTPQNIATLPFTFDGKQADIANILGMSHSGIDESDYNESPYLKMNTTGDWLIIHFDERPGKLTYDIKANTGSAQAFSGTFTVQESADGVTYRNLAVYTTIKTTKESKAHNCFDKDTRYIKFIFTTKNNGNVALGNIKIDESVVTLVTPSVVEQSYFSVGNNKYVQFSTGNLQYEVGTNTWSFASEQYKVIGGAAYDGTNNTNFGMNVPGYTGKLDLFAWSADGKFGVNPSNKDADYQEAFVDWGELVNEAGWYTLTQAEMRHILNRKKDGKKLWTTAELAGKIVLILLPDNWDTAIDLAYGYVPATGNYDKNVLTIELWKALEEKGAVLLPSGGSRTGGYGNKIGFDGETVENDAERLDANSHYFNVNNVGDYGFYWLNTPTSSGDCVNCASYLLTPGFLENDPTKNEDDQYTSPQVPSREKRRGNSVRLVKEVTPNYTRPDQAAGVYGTVCYPENIVWCDGATLYEVAGKEGNKVIFDEVTTPEAGMPYIFIAEQEKVNFFCGSESATEAGKHNSLQGTFTQIDPAVDNILVDNYMLVNNIIKKCGANCGLYANRAYFIGLELERLGTAPSPVQGRRRISLEVTNENTTTGLDNITNGENTTIKTIENGQLIIIRNGEKYNAQGIKF